MVRSACTAVVLSICLATISCGSGSSAEGNASADIHGAGASFPAPLYDRWFKDYVRAHPNVRVDYQSVGSGAGITQFTNKTVDFGASDAAMTDEEIAKVDKGVQLIPLTAGSIVLSYNIPDLKSPLRLSRDAYAGIFLGKITKWSDRSWRRNPGPAADPRLRWCRADSSATSCSRST